MLPRATSKLQWLTARRPPKSFTKPWMLSSGGAAGDSASLRVPVERGSEPGTGLVSDTSSNLAMALVARLMRGHPTRLAGGGWTGAGRSAGALRDLLLPGGLGAPA